MDGYLNVARWTTITKVKVRGGVYEPKYIVRGS